MSHPLRVVGARKANTETVADARGLEFGDTDTRTTWQGKTGLVLHPLGAGTPTRTPRRPIPHLRQLVLNRGRTPARRGATPTPPHRPRGRSPRRRGRGGGWRGSARQEPGKGRARVGVRFSAARMRACHVHHTHRVCARLPPVR